jgi:hypothetical protein
MRATVAMLAGLFCFAVTPVAHAADEIHWTIMGQTAVSFDWRGSETTVSYGLTAAYGHTATGVTPTPIPISSAGPFYEARITGLQENTLYHYSIGSGPDHTFRTPPPRGSSNFTVCAEGDVGDGTTFPRMRLVQADIAAGNPAFILLEGDISYANDFGQAAADRHFNDVMVWSRDAAYMPAWGNHEWDTPEDDLRNYKGRFDLPNPQTSPGSPSVSCCGEDWYWFDYGNARFIAYPEPFSGAWSDWNTKARVLMDQAQADPAIQFIVTFGHRPAYSSGYYYPGDATLKRYLDAFGAAHSKYVLNLNGHSHDYERTHPQSGVTHITVGNGGANLEAEDDEECRWGGGCPPPAWTAYRAMHHGSLRLHFTPGGIQGEEICGPAGSSSSPNDITCQEGSVIDAFTIGTPTLSAPPPATEAFRLIAAAPNPVTDDLDVLFTLDGRGAATLEVLDVAGRRIHRADLGSGPGGQSIRVPRSVFPHAGLFYLRLRQAGHEVNSKIVVVR